MGIPAHFLQPYPNMVLGLSGALTSAKGSIKLKFESGSAPQQLKMYSEFVVFDTPSPYDAVMGQPLLFSLRAAVSLYHYSIKFPTPHGVGKVKENRELVERCQWKTCTSHQCSSPGDQIKELKVGCELQPSTRSKIVAFQKENLDVFAWDHSDMRGIDPTITCHKLTGGSFSSAKAAKMTTSDS
ncbi:uncharacterized protein LOC111411235 [Olea europaea var. sylvestris]|uniref:uncharacterized protein LOC111411235 n=1 Tax=Olea europaea var. sylvestris TaxID=158386 RepID=UPI000C1D2176|nr:uncharacterized protein LOC111411235 [Olea europaea var. sylvestris]